MASRLITPSQLSLLSINPVIGAWWEELQAQKLIKGSKPAVSELDQQLWLSPLAPLLQPTDWSSRCVDSSKSQKRMTLSGDKIFRDTSDIDCKALSTDDYRTKALRTLIIFQRCCKARDFNSADSKAA
jgi:hypothetical protein